MRRWISESGGNFHFIIDDGGHQNDQIKKSFDILYHEALLPGGYYFIEDLQVGRASSHSGDMEDTMSDVLQAWMEQLIIHQKENDKPVKYVSDMIKKYPLPKDVKWIFCQYEACVIAKCEYQAEKFCAPGYW